MSEFTPARECVSVAKFRDSPPSARSPQKKRNPGEKKGPHLHTIRDSYFVCTRGKVVFIIKTENGNYEEIESSEENPTLVHIPKNIPSAHINLSNKISSVLALASHSWKPNDNEMQNVTFDDYDWKKWD